MASGTNDPESQDATHGMNSILPGTCAPQDVELPTYSMSSASSATPIKSEPALYGADEDHDTFVNAVLSHFRYVITFS